MQKVPNQVKLIRPKPKATTVDAHIARNRMASKTESMELGRKHPKISRNDEEAENQTGSPAVLAELFLSVLAQRMLTLQTSSGAFVGYDSTADDATAKNGTRRKCS